MIWVGGVEFINNTSGEVLFLLVNQSCAMLLFERAVEPSLAMSTDALKMCSVMCTLP